MERAGPALAKQEKLVPILTEQYQKIWREYVSEKESENVVIT